jgi:chemotaxis protein MotB
LQRKKAAAHENHERWLVSYADFITLLFAFFVVMFASTQADKAKARQVSESVRAALEQGEFSNVLSTVLGKGRHENNRTAAAPRPDAQTSGAGMKVPEKEVGAPKGSASEVLPPPEDLSQSAARLQSALAAELAGGKVAVRLESRGLIISLREASFFGSGDDHVAPSSMPMLAKIAAVVAALPNPVRLEGHTDSIPIHTARFPSNWELSTARAIATLELLAQRYKIAPCRMAAAGYAENAPAESNETAHGRAHNRRVDIVLLTREGLRIEPSTAVPPAIAPLTPGKPK